MTILNNTKTGGTWKRSSLEKKFERLWELTYPEITLVVEQQLVPGRKFRSDYYHEESKTSVELQGGTYLKFSSHKGAGSLKDYYKNNQLLLQGIVTILLGTSDIDRDNIELIHTIIQRRLTC